jgi:lysophospholipid acyltransferase
LPSKRYYDFACWLFTQLTFSYTVAPFILLNLADCLAVWGAVYFYAIIWIAASLAFFASPAKGYLIQQLKRRGGGRPAPQRMESSDKPILGMPSDPEKAVREAVDEIRAEVELRRRQGFKVQMPDGQELKEMVNLRLEKKKSEGQ